MKLRWRGSTHLRIISTADIESLGLDVDDEGFTADQTTVGADVIDVSEELANWLLENDPGWLRATEDATPIVDPAISLAHFDQSTAPEVAEPVKLEYEDMDVKDLKAEIRSRNEHSTDDLQMNVSGTKDELVTRLRDYDAALASAEATADEGDQQDK
jgi:hypothetical protein